MTVADEIRAAEPRVRAADRSLIAWLSEIGVSYTTWQRWRAGDSEPRVSEWEEIRSRIERLPRIVPPDATAPRPDETETRS